MYNVVTVLVRHHKHDGDWRTHILSIFHELFCILSAGFWSSVFLTLIRCWFAKKWKEQRDLEVQQKTEQPVNEWLTVAHHHACGMEVKLVLETSRSTVYTMAENMKIPTQMNSSKHPTCTHKHVWLHGFMSFPLGWAESHDHARFLISDLSPKKLVFSRLNYYASAALTVIMKSFEQLLFRFPTPQTFSTTPTHLDSCVRMLLFYHQDIRLNLNIQRCIFGTPVCCPGNRLLGLPMLCIVHCVLISAGTTWLHGG